MNAPFLRTSLLCLVIASLFSLSACTKAPETAIEPVLRSVRVMDVSVSGVPHWREFPGVVKAAQQADLGFRVPGKLATILVKEGDRVKEGQVLATLDDTDYQIQLASRKADYAQAKADFDRAESLLKKRLIAKADYDKLQAQHASAKAAKDTAQKNVDYTLLKAPFAGVIARQHIENFEDVSTLQAIFTLQDLSTLHIEVAIPETVMIRLKQKGAGTVFAIFDALPNRQFPLALQAVSTQADPGSKTFTVTFNMPAVSDANILPGMSVTVRGSRVLEEETDSLLVPAMAVMEDASGRFVYVVESVNKGVGTVQRRPVETGRISEQGINVTSGLGKHDLLVTAGMSKMSEGLKVKIDQEWTQ